MAAHEGTAETRTQTSEEKPNQHLSSTLVPPQAPTITIEELSELDQVQQNPDIEVIQPDGFEEAESDTEIGTGEFGQEPVSEETISGRLRRLRCDDDVASPKRSLRRDADKRKWKSGTFKRTYSQSAEDDVDSLHVTAAEDGKRKAHARSLRRRIGSPDSRIWVGEASDGSAYEDHSSRDTSVPTDSERLSPSKTEGFMEIDQI